MTSPGHLAFCLAEDRIDCETGLRIAILSVCRHCPETPVYVYRPDVTSAFAIWIEQFPQVRLIRSRPIGASSWNCKPNAILPLLEAGHREIVWLDSDIVVTRDCRDLFTDLAEPVIAIAQEPASLPYQGTRARTAGWNLEIGREFHITLNSSVVRVTNFHIPLLKQWMTFMGEEDYIAAQTRPLEQRPLHIMSDQDVLCALLGAREFADIPVRVLATGTEIIHVGGALGYSCGERMRSLLRPKPAFIHAAAGKPWLWLGGDEYWSKNNFFSWHRRLLQELSPYVYEARRYEGQLHADTNWMHARTLTGAFLRLSGLGHFALRGLPLTAVASILSTFRRA
jgi:hypothetical protein